MYDFDRGSKVTGRKFYFTTGSDAVIEWELITQMVEYHRHHKYEFVIPPYLVRREIAENAGILPRFEGQFYEIEKDKLVLIPTAEIPLVGMHKNEIFKENELPIKYVAFSPCFRRESGSHGKRDKGLRRVHQFHKVELFEIVHPDLSKQAHEDMVNHILEMMRTLFPSIQFRTRELSENERSPISCKTIDIEIKCGNEWLEVSSISNTRDLQARPALIRYRPSIGGKPKKCHLLNGSALALPRLICTLKEQNNGAIV